MSKRNLKAFVEASIHPSAYELAEVFWAMDAEEQAEFFNHLGEIADRLPMQMQAVVDHPVLTAAGWHAMACIADYGAAQQQEGRGDD